MAPIKLPGRRKAPDVPEFLVLRRRLMAALALGVATPWEAVMAAIPDVREADLRATLWALVSLRFAEIAPDGGVRLLVDPETLRES